jgi:translation elongation factor EF-Tu-like GTPase
LVAALDAKIELPDREKDKSFLMSVDTAMNISGRGCVVTGTIE